MNAGRRRHHRVPACQAGTSHELADPGTACLHPLHAGRAGRHGGWLLPVEVEADVGLAQQRSPLGPLRWAETRGGAVMVAGVTRLRQQVRPVEHLNPRAGGNVRHLFLFEE